MSVDLHDVRKGVYEALQANATVVSRLSDRIYSAVPTSHTQFPMCRFTLTPDDFETGSMDSGGVIRVWRVGLEFLVYDNTRSGDLAAAALDAICEVLESEALLNAEYSGLSINCLASTPGVRWLDYDEETNSSVAGAMFSLMLQET